ncbi:MAG: SRPBCC family protein [Acidobacteriota bacterium]
MAGFQVSETINAPIEEVFDFATSLDNTKNWLPGVISCEPVTEGEMRPGYRFKETRRQGKKEKTAEIEVVEHHRPKVHAAKAQVSSITAIYRFTFEADGHSRTRVDCVADVKATGIMKLLTGLLAKAMKSADGKMLANLKNAIENGSSQAAA